MALSSAQQQLLDQLNVSPDLRNWIAQEFNEQGRPKGIEAPDFLMVLSDHLQAAEAYLAAQRSKLSRLQSPKQEKKVSSEEWQVMITAAEEQVKEAWLGASAFWQMLDRVVSTPEDYNVILTRRQIEYAFQKKNLPLIEALRRAKPEYFAFATPAFSLRILAAMLGCAGGIFSGFWGRMLRYKQEAAKHFILVRPLLFLGYLVEATLIGTARGMVAAGNFAFQTGRVLLAIRLGYHAAWYNPFSDPIGSKNQQTVELKTLEGYFLVSARQH